MKSLCLLLAWLGQFQVIELETKPPSLFLQEELTVTSKQEKPPEEKLTFDLLTAPWCGACIGVKNTLGIDSRGVSTKDVRFTVRTWNVDSRGWLGATTIPAFAYKGKVFQYGYSNPENLLENYRKIVLKTKTVSQSSYPSYHGYKPRWTWPGDLRTHLRQVHGVTESLTQDQAEALHDALHEGFTLQQLRTHFKGKH